MGLISSYKCCLLSIVIGQPQGLSLASVYSWCQEALILGPFIKPSCIVIISWSPGRYILTIMQLFYENLNPPSPPKPLPGINIADQQWPGWPSRGPCLPHTHYLTLFYYGLYSYLLYYTLLYSSLETLFFYSDLSYTLLYDIALYSVLFTLYSILYTLYSVLYFTLQR